MSICIVTGAAGFIGSHLAEALVANGRQVIGVDALTDNYDIGIKESNLTALRRNPNFTFLQARIEQLRPNDLPWAGASVFHLAGQPGVRDSWGAGFPEFVRNNIIATQVLLEILRTERSECLVLASSSSVYGGSRGAPLQESEETSPLSPYGITKLATEKLCLAYSSEYAIKTILLRFFSAYGPRQRPDMFAHKLLKSAMDGRVIPIFGPLDQARDFTYVSDIVQACIAAVALPERATIVNVANGTPISLGECIRTAERVTGRLIPFTVEERRAGEATMTHADISKARLIWGRDASVSLETGLRRQWHWMLKLEQFADIVQQPATKSANR